MNWDDVIKIVFTIIGGFGGIYVVTGIVIKFSADRIAERLSAKYQLRLNKELESFRSSLLNKTHISRALFEKEFAIYQDLIEKFYEAFPHIEVVKGLMKSDIKVLSKAEIALDNPELEHITHLHAEGKVITEIQIQDQCDQIAKAMLNYRKTLQKSGAMIPHKIQLLFSKMYDTAYIYVHESDRNKSDSYANLLSSIGEMQVKLREYLESLAMTD
jgi:hypothetical protein